MSCFRSRFRFISIIAVVTMWTAWSVSTAHGRDGIARGTTSHGCPDLVELIEEVTPVVVNISIERHMLQNSSTEPPPLFRPRPGRPGTAAEKNDRYQVDSLGSGFVYDDKGHVITNAHVVEGATQILVKLYSGKVCPATVVAQHPKVDLALLKIDPPHHLRKARIGNSSDVKVGQWVLAVGNPFGLSKTVTFGIVSGKGRFIGLGPDDDFIQTDASINPGNSGGPLFDMDGRVIGVNTAIIASGKGIGFSIPSNYVHELVRSREDMKRPQRGWLGVYVEDMTKEQARELGLVEPRGTYVDEVLRSTPASEAGLRKGDLILEAQNKPVRNGRHLSAIVAGSKPGDLLTIGILRKGRNRSLDVVIGKAPE